MDFGCVTIDRSLKLYLFGTPGPGPVRLHVGRPGRGRARRAGRRGQLAGWTTATRRSTTSSGPALPFVVAVNAFDGRLAHSLDEVRWALAVDPDVPVISFDARDRLSVRDALLVLLDRALDRAVHTRAT